MKPRLGTTVKAGPAPVLDAAQRAAFAEEGYLAIEGFLDAEALAAVRGLVEGLLARPEPVADGMRFDYLAPDGSLVEATLPQLLLPFDYEPRLFETELFLRGARLARDLLGEALRYRGSHYMEKPARIGPDTPWHQDEAFWEPTHRHEAVAIWLPLEGATVESGCLHFVGGTHSGEALRPHQRIGRDPRVHGLELEGDADAARAVACPLEPGGVTVHHCRVVHGAGPNRSSAPRRALVLNLEAPPVPLPSPRDVPWQATSSEAARRREEKEIELP